MPILWNDVIIKTSVAQLAVGFGGDFNCTSVHWTFSGWFQKKHDASIFFAMFEKNCFDALKNSGTVFFF